MRTRKFVSEAVFNEDPDGGNVTLKYVLPQQSIQTVLHHIYASVYGAHLGRKKTRNRILERIYRPFLMQKKINIIYIKEDN